ncbi:DUF411 domain-containing protein [Vibrio ostreicida]|uniref:DUF411 domain-containing protein n=1 Tax=Vibrio ostreicida TaxID=526588 RepID=A0ABT8BSC5_9VIBR|nr:DUF411 domain-containing protein [Vibrio ostreicida]MDN3609336.1 DUF411 domain-containing protein [Vibrio ostreicida]NPD08228.1 DUF411 domain-containing protein [Vibrio ostreicida]
MKTKLLPFLSLALVSSHALANEVLNHKSPYCGCCSEWSKHMRDAGFTVEEELHQDMAPIKQKLGITPELSSCHTAEINGYVFEGHVPAQDIKAFLANPPKDAKGLAVPGMPMGSPGMEYGKKNDAYSVYAFNEKHQAFEYRTYPKGKF